MSRKSFWDIYSRNMVGFFQQGFPKPDQWTLAWLPAAIVFLVISPLTLFFGVGTKTLIDFFSRKEKSVEEMGELNAKIDDSSEKEIVLLVTDIYKYKAQSKSSQKLKEKLEARSTEANQVIASAMQAKKMDLQKMQFNSENSVELVENTATAIGNVKLNKINQAELDAFNTDNSAHCNYQKIQEQKKLIKAYLDARHNSGKKMQHIIYDHFFFIPAPQVEPKIKDLPITALPINAS